MKIINYFLLLLTPIIIYATSTFSNQIIPIINLNTTNLLLLKGEINKETTNVFLHNLHLLENKKDAFVFLDTNGGSVEHGNKIVNEIIKYNMSCIVEKAYSMGFVILQACKIRYILPFGKIMQHQISFRIQNEKAKVESYLLFINQIEEKLITLQSHRIGLSLLEFKEKTYNDWWLFGENALTNNCADEIVNIECSSKLVKEIYKISDKKYDYIYSKCPLIPDYIEKKEKKQKKLDIIDILDLDEYFVFI
jgi:ATP-dependent protease ClpP protease subunit